MALLRPTGEFVMGIENECLTAVAGTPALDARGKALASFFESLHGLAPSLPGPGGSGLFNGYGRVYLDLNAHLELASAECDSPLLLASLVERQQQLVEIAVEAAARHAPRLILANNNHDGLLRACAPTWGSHESYWVERHPSSLADAILPFLVTRIYAGSGGVVWPTGEFVAGVRPLFMTLDVGGGTTGQRAIHSTARNEPLMGSQPGGYRYHLLVGDGHRSQFSLALQLGTTALALRAIAFDPSLVEKIPGLEEPGRCAFWLSALRKFQRLAWPGQSPRVSPVAIRIQRIYLEGARRYTAATPSTPGWVHWALHAWESTLEAFEWNDQAWLSARLDPWIKYQLYSSFLCSRGHSWHDLPGHADLFPELRSWTRTTTSSPIPIQSSHNWNRPGRWPIVCASRSRRGRNPIRSSLPPRPAHGPGLASSVTTPEPRA